jgi:mRNA interferase YafQ
MRTIKYTNKFNRDYRREKSGKPRKHGEQLDRELTAVVALLAADAALPRRYADHPLGGDGKDFRDCHIKPDLVLHLSQAGFGSHSELGL